MLESSAKELAARAMSLASRAKALAARSDALEASTAERLRLISISEPRLHKDRLGGGPNPASQLGSHLNNAKLTNLALSVRQALRLVHIRLNEKHLPTRTPSPNLISYTICYVNYDCGLVHPDLSLRPAVAE